MVWISFAGIQQARLIEGDHRQRRLCPARGRFVRSALLAGALEGVAFGRVYGVPQPPSKKTVFALPIDRPERLT